MYMYITNHSNVTSKYRAQFSTTDTEFLRKDWVDLSTVYYMYCIYWLSLYMYMYSDSNTKLLQQLDSLQDLTMMYGCDTYIKWTLNTLDGGDSCCVWLRVAVGGWGVYSCLVCMIVEAVNDVGS